MVKISVVSPVYEEEENISPLYEELREVLEGLDKSYEIIFVDDGSPDDSYGKMEELASQGENFRAVKLRKNFGQSSALQAGFDAAEGDVIISIDSDLQNDPKDIPKLLKKLEEGYDCVSGWRHERRDPRGKRIWTNISSGIRRFFLGTDIHDLGCTLRAYTREAVEELELSGEMHRYVPALLRWRGFNVMEVKVNHRERKHGETKYGSSRIFKGFMDMINVWFWQKFHGRPLHLFGGLGLVSMGIGVLAAILSLYWKIFRGVHFDQTPLPLFASFTFLTGVILFVMGLLSDVMLKTYYRSREMKTYSVEKIED